MCYRETAVEDETISKDRVRIEIGNDVEIIYSDSTPVKARVTAPTLNISPINFTYLCERFSKVPIKTAYFKS